MDRNIPEESAYIDGVFPDEEYHRQKRLLEMELDSLTVPQANAAEGAGQLIMTLKELWAGANLAERRRLLLSMLDAVYFDTKKLKSIVAIRPKPPFKPVFQVAASRDGSGIRIINEPYLGSSVFLVEAGESGTPGPIPYDIPVLVGQILDQLVGLGETAAQMKKAISEG